MHAPAALVPLAAAAVAVLALAGCAQPAAEPTEAPTTAPTSQAPEPTTEPTATEDPTAIDTSDWLTYETTDSDASFRYPADWTLESDAELFAPDADRDDVQDPYERTMDSATLTAPNGQQLLALADFVDIGGACGGIVFPFEVLAQEPSEAAALDGGGSVIATVAIGTETDRWIMGIGITDAERLEYEEACTTYFVAGSSDGGVGFGTHFQMGSTDDDPLWSIDSLDDARAYMETDEYRTILEILRSFEVR
ncbi:hypothetical protein OVA14_03045 [Agrococcus sp. SL85]|uniref:hypothetical protein n=1 Tax=Agrococcus sp. SL85 TaxID=2995141 RepID=UPI00226C97AD|nr:hypothetical protein [Agrococcus sp. SL85]WAC66767.1 hypothetical protein OVA14_03045 [Agrococcus sp. SL85]